MNLNASPPILIVVDEPIVAKELQQSLLAKGYDAIVVAASADQAIAGASRAHPDALQMDIRGKGLVDWIELTLHKRELESALLESRQQIRDMTQRLEMVREQERHAIAVLLHDGIAQELFAVKLGLHQLRALAKKRRSVKSLCSEMELAIVQCMESTRFAVIELRPVALAYSPLSSVIAEYARHFGERSNLDVKFTEAGRMQRLSRLRCELTAVR